MRTMMTSRSEPTLRLIWRHGGQVCSCTYLVSDPSWKEIFHFYAADPASHIRLLYNR